VSKGENNSGRSNSFSYEETKRLLEMFSLLDQGRDVSAYLRSKPIRSIRAKFQTMRDKQEQKEGDGQSE
jgi:hypothetical protein